MSRSIEEELTDLMLGDSEIQAFVDGRVGPLPKEQGPIVAPEITYFQSSREDAQTQSGPECLIAHSYQIDTWSPVYGEARDLAELVRKRLNGFDAALGAFQRVTIFLENKRDTFEDESMAHRGILDFTVWYREEL